VFSDWNFVLPLCRACIVLKQLSLTYALGLCKDLRETYDFPRFLLYCTTSSCATDSSMYRVFHRVLHSEISIFFELLCSATTCKCGSSSLSSPLFVRGGECTEGHSRDSRPWRPVCQPNACFGLDSLPLAVAREPSVLRGSCGPCLHTRVTRSCKYLIFTRHTRYLGLNPSVFLRTSVFSLSSHSSIM